MSSDQTVLEEWFTSQGEIKQPVGARTTVANIKGSQFDVLIDRRTEFGNPYKMKSEKDRRLVILRYRKYFYKKIIKDPEFLSAVAELRGKVLGCWCKPKDCHGDVIAQYLNTLDEVYDDFEIDEVNKDHVFRARHYEHGHLNSIGIYISPLYHVVKPDKSLLVCKVCQIALNITDSKLEVID